MLREEAAWLRQQLEKLDPATVYPMCNLGSSTWHFRTVEQPYIDAELFIRARRLGQRVVHVDMKADPGVDVVGDYSDTALATDLQKVGFCSVMCCNILEHVVDRQRFSTMAASLVQTGGYVIVSVPNEFPYHEDPIDTMFRPDINEVAALFSGMEVVSAQIVRSSRFVYEMGGSWRNAFWLGVRVCVPFHRPKRWLASVRYVLKLWRGYRVTCVILRRPSLAKASLASQ
jgi:hypothetical protein